MTQHHTSAEDDIFPHPDYDGPERPMKGVYSRDPADLAAFHRLLEQERILDRRLTQEEIDTGILRYSEADERRINDLLDQGVIQRIAP